MIFSKGFYSDSHCVHLKPGTGHLSATFEIFLNSCGMSSSANHNANGYNSPTPSGSYVENTIIIQYDPYVQEVWDQVIARAPITLLAAIARISHLFLLLLNSL